MATSSQSPSPPEIYFPSSTISDNIERCCCCLMWHKYCRVSIFPWKSFCWRLHNSSKYLMILGSVFFSHWNLLINPYFNELPPHPPSLLEREVGAILLARWWVGAFGSPWHQKPPRRCLCLWRGCQWPRCCRYATQLVCEGGEALLQSPKTSPLAALGLPWSHKPAASELGTLKRACCLFYSSTFCPQLEQYPCFIQVYASSIRVPQHFRSTETHLLLSNTVVDSV